MDGRTDSVTHVTRVHLLTPSKAPVTVTRRRRTQHNTGQCRQPVTLPRLELTASRVTTQPSCSVLTQTNLNRNSLVYANKLDLMQNFETAALQSRGDCFIITPHRV
jgi:hypothetical protein